MKVTITVWILAVLVAAIALLDVGLIATRGYEATISWTLHAWSKELPVIPFIFGFVGGHLFWAIKGPAPKKEIK